MIELVLAVFILTAVVLGFARFGQKGMVNITKLRQRSNASHFASTEIESIKQQPYLLVPLTAYQPAYFGATACDCRQVDWAGLPKTKVKSGQTEYTVQTCVNRVQPVGNNWVSACPSAPDTGFKQIFSHVTWNNKGEKVAFNLDSLVSRSTGTSSNGNIVVNLCHASEPFNAGSPCDISGTAVSRISISSVAAFAVSGRVSTTSNFSFPGAGIARASLSVKAPGTYSVQIQAPGFFPVRIPNITIAAGQTVTLPGPGTSYPLRRIAYFGSSVAGEMYGVDRPVISKVMAYHIQSCMFDRTEALEIYNPTPNTLEVPSSSFSVTYWLRYKPKPYKSAPSSGDKGYPDFAYTSYFMSAQFYLGCVKNGPPGGPKDAGIPSGPTPACTIKVPPKHSLLIMGVNDVSNPSNNPTGVRPDIWYKASPEDPFSDVVGYFDQYFDLIPHNDGAGVQVSWFDGVRTVNDSVRWNGLAAPWAAAPTSALGFWEGPPLPAGKGPAPAQ